MHIGEGTKFGRANLLISTCSISFLPNYSFSILSASFDCFTTYLLLKQLPPSLMCNCAIRLRNTRGHPFNLTLSCEDTFPFQPNTPSRQFNLQRRRSKLPISDSSRILLLLLLLDSSMRSSTSWQENKVSDWKSSRFVFIRRKG